MTGSDLNTLRTIRSRRLDKATAAKQRCDRKLAAARQAEAEAERAVQHAEQTGRLRINDMYKKLLAAGVCSVKDLDDVKFEEARLREKLAQLAKAAKDAAAAVVAAATAVEEARKQVVTMNAAVEAIDMISSEQRAEEQIEAGRLEDEIIDEVALLRRA